MKEKGLKQDDLIPVFGVKTRGAVGHYLTGRREPNGDQLKALADKLNHSLDWLLTGKGQIIRPALPSPESNAEWGPSFDLWDSDTPLRDDEVALPFFREVLLSAGAGISEIQENHGCKLRFAKSTLRSVGVDESHAACVKVSGNSMEPVLPDGSTVGVDQLQTNIIDGEMYAIDHCGHLRVKLLYKMPGGKIRIRSYNLEEWPDEMVDPNELRVIGWVFWQSVLRKRKNSYVK